MDVMKLIEKAFVLARTIALNNPYCDDDCKQNINNIQLIVDTNYSAPASVAPDASVMIFNPNVLDMYNDELTKLFAATFFMLHEFYHVVFDVKKWLEQGMKINSNLHPAIITKLLNIYHDALINEFAIADLIGYVTSEGLSLTKAKEIIATVKAVVENYKHVVLAESLEKFVKQFASIIGKYCQNAEKLPEIARRAVQSYYSGAKLVNAMYNGYIESVRILKCAQVPPQLQQQNQQQNEGQQPQQAEKKKQETKSQQDKQTGQKQSDKQRPLPRQGQNQNSEQQNQQQKDQSRQQQPQQAEKEERAKSRQNEEQHVQPDQKQATERQEKNSKRQCPHSRKQQTEQNQSSEQLQKQQSQRECQKCQRQQRTGGSKGGKPNEKEASEQQSASQRGTPSPSSKGSRERGRVTSHSKEMKESEKRENRESKEDSKNANLPKEDSKENEKVETKPETVSRKKVAASEAQTTEKQEKEEGKEKQDDEKKETGRRSKDDDEISEKESRENSEIKAKPEATDSLPEKKEKENAEEQKNAIAHGERAAEQHEIREEEKEGEERVNIDEEKNEKSQNNKQQEKAKDEKKQKEEGRKSTSPEKERGNKKQGREKGEAEKVEKGEEENSENTSDKKKSSQRYVTTPRGIKSNSHGDAGVTKVSKPSVGRRIMPNINVKDVIDWIKRKIDELVNKKKEKGEKEPIDVDLDKLIKELEEVLKQTQKTSVKYYKKEVEESLPFEDVIEGYLVNESDWTLTKIGRLDPIYQDEDIKPWAQEYANTKPIAVYIVDTSGSISDYELNAMVNVVLQTVEKTSFTVFIAFSDTVSVAILTKEDIEDIDEAKQKVWNAIAMTRGGGTVIELALATMKEVIEKITEEENIVNGKLVVTVISDFIFGSLNKEYFDMVDEILEQFNKRTLLAVSTVPTIEALNKTEFVPFVQLMYEKFDEVRAFIMKYMNNKIVLKELELNVY